VAQLLQAPSNQQTPEETRANQPVATDVRLSPESDLYNLEVHNLAAEKLVNHRDGLLQEAAQGQKGITGSPTVGEVTQDLIDRGANPADASRVAQFQKVYGIEGGVLGRIFEPEGAPLNPEQKAGPDVDPKKIWGSKQYQPAPPEAERATEGEDPRIVRSRELEEARAGAHSNPETEKATELALDAERQRIAGFLDGRAVQEQDPHYARLAKKFESMYGSMPDRPVSVAA